MKNIKKLEPQKYEIRFSYVDDLTGKRKRIRRRIEGSLQDAIAYRDQLRAQAHRGDLGRSEKPSAALTLREMKDQWVESRRSETRRRAAVAESTHQKDMSVLTKHILPEVGDWVPSGIQSHHLETLTDTWAAKRKRGGKGDLYSPVTVNNWIKVAKVYLGWCFRRVGRSTAILDDWQKLPTKGRAKKGRALSPQEAKAFLDGLRDDQGRPNYWYALAYVLLATGQRFGSVTALEWDDVGCDWITFQRSHYKGVVEEGNKSGKVVRLPMTPDLKRVLDDHRRHLFAKQRAGIRTGLVFPAQVHDPEGAANNGYLEASSLGKVMASACDDAGIPHTTPHDLRRTFNSWCAERVPGTVLRSITAHSSAGMTDHYYHGSREAKADAIEGVTSLVR